MPITVLIRPGGGGVALDYGPVTGLTLTPSTTQLGIAFTAKSATVAPGARYLVEYCPVSDRVEQPNNPFRWKRLTFIASSASSFAYKHAWELEGYDVQVTTVTPDGTRSAPATATSAPVPQWVPQNQLALYSQDFSQGSAWKVSGSGTAPVTGTAGAGQTVTFSAANTAFNQLLDIDLSAGKTYTFWYDLQGTAASTFAITAYDRALSGGTDFTGTYAGTREQFAFTRTYTTAGGQQGLFVGPNTYGGTNRSVTLYRMAVSEGTFTAAQMAAQYEASQGPGTTWQGPRYWDATNTSAGMTTWGGYNRSNTPTIPVHNVQTANPITFTGRMQGKGDMVNYYAGSGSIDIIGAMARGLHPGVAGRKRGWLFKGDYASRVRVQRSYVLQTSGIFTQYFRGASAALNISITQTIFDELDGRYAAGVTGYVQGAWGSTQSRPSGAPLGWESCGMFHVSQLDMTTPYNVSGCEVGSNLVLSRPGFSRFEDVINLSEAPTTGVNDPWRIYQNMIDARGAFYDFNALALIATATATTWSTGTIPAPYTLTLSNSAAAVAASATTMTLTTAPNVNLSAGQVLSFGGASVTVGSGHSGSSTALPLNGAGAAVAIGAVATLARTDSPYAYSGSLIQAADSSTHNYVTLTKNMANVEIYGNRGVGQGTIFGLLDGRNIRYAGGNRLVAAPTMQDGVTTYSGPRSTSGPQITQYIGDGWRDGNSIVGLYVKTGFLQSYLDAAVTQNLTPNSNYSGTPASNERYQANLFVTTPATVEEEWAELATWQAEMSGAGIQIGPFA